MNISDKIQTSEYIYSTFTNWGLKKFICDVEYFTTEPLNDLFYVICSILNSNGGSYNKRSLGVLLGFCMCNQKNEEKYDTYFDIAEVRMFEDILSKVEKEHLIIINGNDVILTMLGRISLKANKHFRFYKGKQIIYEHLKLKSETPTTLLMFPFYKDMGIYTQLSSLYSFWPEDENIEKIIYYQKNQLIKRIENHSTEEVNIYFAYQEEYFDIEKKEIQIKLYKSNGEYIPVVVNGDDIAEKATNIILQPINTDRKEDLILECLFQKLWDDKNVSLSHQTLNDYYDLVDFEELTKDQRTSWDDEELFNVIIERSNQTCWRNISRFCTLNVLYSHIEQIKDKIDWPIFTSRVDDYYLIENFLTYPWDLEVISEDANREEKVIEKLLLLQKDTEEEWNWDLLEQRISSKFVLEHLDLVKVDLSVYTEDSQSVREAILSHVDKRWDWEKIESTFDLGFIYNHISELGNNFVYTCLFDRVFTDENWAEKFVNNRDFQVAISNASKDEGPLASCILNDKKYIWKPSIIDLFAKLNLIIWSSTPYMQGFECNPSLVWDNNFFDKYSNNIKTEEGQSFVSKSITDLNILINYPNFDWVWESISSNPFLLSNVELYNLYGDKLNWKIIFNNQHNVEFLQGIEDIESMIADDEDAWSLFSKVATLDYVKVQYKSKGFPWDWSILTERMFHDLKLENIGHPLFIKKWDWNYLSEHLPIDFVLANLEKYSYYWNWEFVFNRILTESNRLDITYLDSIAYIITNILDKEKSNKAWTALTKQYKFKELKKLIKETASRQLYWWNIDYFCQHENFNVFTDLSNFYNIVNWNVLSNSKSIDNSLKFNSKFGIKPKAWTQEVIAILSDTRNKWDFKALSKFESLRDERWFLSHFKDKIDWEYISGNSKIFTEEDKQKLSEIIDAYKNYINFKVLSERTDVNIEQIVKIHPKADYNYNFLIKNGIIKVGVRLVDDIPDYQWDWFLMSSYPSFVPSASWLMERLDKYFNWEFMTSHENVNAWSNEELLQQMASNGEISKKVNWLFITEQKQFPLKESLLLYLPFDGINWKAISQNKNVITIIDTFKDVLDWKVLSANTQLDVSNQDFLEKYKENLYWDIVCSREDFKFTNSLLELFQDYIDWDKASSSLDIQFSRELVEKYQEKWNWPVLVKNKAFNNNVNVDNMPIVKQINIVDFIRQFPYRPHAYHFTHMSNAIQIIRNMKLQCRNYAKGNFTNSAGSNVNRTAKAHRFARFYFAPKSPTQFYNECLGKDMDSGYYYDKAKNLGLPKCPLPVFFVFDIEELLMTMPDKCYYSTGNMQKDSSKSYKVIESPNYIKAREIYIDNKSTFNERQQEFLIEGELDFSKLKKVQIFCYDTFQASMLRKELKGTQWEDVISVDRNLYIHCNKELIYYESEYSIRISTNDYTNQFEFKVVYYNGNIPTILNKDMVLRQRNNDIYIENWVEINKDVPFDVYFETKVPKIESWLIYKNR